MVAVDSQLLDQRKQRGDKQHPDGEREGNDREQRIETDAADYPTAAGRFHGPIFLTALALIQVGWFAALAYFAYHLIL